MGIYCFNREVLIEALQDDATLGAASAHDFGKDIVPRIFKNRRVFGYQYLDYWRDVGTIEAYWQANMDLIEQHPPLNLANPEAPLRTSRVAETPARFGPKAAPHNALISPGAQIDGMVERSVISPGVVVEEGALVRDSIVCHGAVIRSGAVVDHAIIDKEVQVGSGATVGVGDNSVVNRARPDIVKSGISIVGKRAMNSPGDDSRSERHHRAGGGGGVGRAGSSRVGGDGAARTDAAPPVRLACRLFSVEEARALLPQVQPVLERLRDAFVGLRGVAGARSGAAARVDGGRPPVTAAFAHQR